MTYFTIVLLTHFVAQLSKIDNSDYLYYRPIYIYIYIYIGQCISRAVRTTMILNPSAEYR